MILGFFDVFFFFLDLGLRLAWHTFQFAQSLLVFTFYFLVFYYKICDIYLRMRPIKVDRHPCIISHQMEATILIILKYFSQHARFWKLGNTMHSDIPWFKPENIYSRDAFKLIARERKCLMD